ncbi:MAG TPA: glycoside hydrolase family 44 protein, partial [Mycobacteriales bacterium]|nr:glycoside hydrolase family 44 protein [Mycobacteriales bacterium]
WCAYFFSAADNCSDGGDSAAHGHTALAPWYLQQFAAYDAAHHQRLLDYFDEHFYPQENGVALSSAGDANTQALRLRSTRALWDPSYADESWISDMGMGAVELIPRMRQWVADNYPGTRTSISEYNWGGLESMNGALAQADVLGIFGREGLDRAMLWAPPTTDQPGAFAFRIYRNYDGHGGRFGDVSVKATSADQSKLSVYAAQRSGDGATTVVVVNKTSADLTAPLSLSGSTAATAHVFAYTPGDLAHVVAGPDVAVNGGWISHAYPADSVTLLVLPAGTAVPSASTATITVAPAAVRYGAQLAIGGSLTSGSAGVAGATVDLQARRAGTSTWVTVTSVRSAGDGSLWATVKPAWTAAWRWRFAGSATAGGSTSPARAATVHAALSDSASTTRTSRGRPVVIHGTVRPARPGAVVAVQLRSGSAWKTVRTVKLV